MTLWEGLLVLATALFLVAVLAGLGPKTNGSLDDFPAGIGCGLFLGGLLVALASLCAWAAVHVVIR